jgi:hypothetical protein
MSKIIFWLVWCWLVVGYVASAQITVPQGSSVWCESFQKDTLTANDSTLAILVLPFDCYLKNVSAVAYSGDTCYVKVRTGTTGILIDSVMLTAVNLIQSHKTPAGTGN